MTLFFDVESWTHFLEKAGTLQILLALAQLFWIHYIILSIFFAIQFEIVRVVTTFQKNNKK